MDNQAAIKTLDGVFINSKLVKSTISNIKKLRIFNSVRVCWISEQRDSEGNEIADLLARKV